MAGAALIQTKSQELLSGSPMRVQGLKALGHPQWLSQATSRELDAGWEVELQGLEPVPIWDPGAFKARTLAARPHHRAHNLLILRIKLMSLCPERGLPKWPGSQMNSQEE